METPKYDCPCCKQKTLVDFAIYDICPVCNWEDDPVARANPDSDFGPNATSLSEARRLWQAAIGQAPLT